MDPTEAPSVSGALACSLRDVAAEMVGEQVVQRALSRVPPDVRDHYEAASPVAWVRIEVLETVFGAIAAEMGTTTAELHVRVARTSIERTFRIFWRMLLKLTTDEALMSRTPVIFARSYNRGRLEAHFPRKGRAEITLFDWPDAPDWPLRATRVGIETVLRLAGRKNVQVGCTRAATGAVYVATWL